MKNLVFIVHASMQQDMADHLRGMTEVSGFTFSHVEGHGSQSESDPMLSVQDKVVGYIPRVRVDILLDDTEVQTVLDATRNLPGIKACGIYWVTEVLTYGRL